MCLFVCVSVFFDSSSCCFNIETGFFDYFTRIVRFYFLFLSYLVCCCCCFVVRAFFLSSFSSLLCSAENKFSVLEFMGIGKSNENDSDGYFCISFLEWLCVDAKEKSVKCFAQNGVCVWVSERIYVVWYTFWLQEKMKEKTQTRCFTRIVLVS